MQIRRSGASTKLLLEAIQLFLNGNNVVTIYYTYDQARSEQRRARDILKTLVGNAVLEDGDGFIFQPSYIELTDTDTKVVNLDVCKLRFMSRNSAKSSGDVMGFVKIFDNSVREAW